MPYKIYQPFTANKAHRFRWYPAGSKPKNYVHGLERLRAIINEKRKLDKEEWTEEDRVVFLKEHPRFAHAKAWNESAPKIKVKKLILCTGGSDGINVACLGYDVCWLNSETADLTPATFHEMQDLAENIYLLPDIDATGQRISHKLGLQYLSLRHITLPDPQEWSDWKVSPTDWKGNPCKDVRDYLNHRTKDDFDRLVEHAMPYQFWYWLPRQKGARSQPECDTSILYFFLNRCGYGQFETDADNRMLDTLIRNDAGVVKEIMDKDIQRFINEFLEERNVPRVVRNLFHRGTWCKKDSLNNLKYLKLDFSQSSRDHQMMYFKNEVWHITGDAIRPLKYSDIPGSSVWKRDVAPIQGKKKIMDLERVSLLDSFFKINKNSPPVSPSKGDGNARGQASLEGGLEGDDGQAELEKQFLEYGKQTRSNRTGNPNSGFSENGHRNIESIANYNIEYYRGKEFDFLSFLRNTARIHWQEKNPTPDQTREEEQHLISRLFFIGYFTHTYKSLSKAWGGFVTENNNRDITTASGGTGKGTFLQLFTYFLRTVRLNGRNPKLTDNAHWGENINRWTRLTWIEDCRNSFDFEFFYPFITGDQDINQKFVKQISIPFEELSKLIYDSNYPLRKMDDSSKRRLLYTAFGDYYHSGTITGKFQHSHRPIDDFGREFYTDWDRPEWNKCANLVAQCTQFYLQTGNDKLNPPMKDIESGELQASLLKGFNEWAEDYFNDPAHRNCMIDKKELYTSFKVSTDTKGGSSNFFTRSLKHYCALKKWEYNPIDICTDKQEQRINNKNVYSIFIWDRTEPIKEEFYPKSATVETGGGGQMEAPF